MEVAQLPESVRAHLPNGYEAGQGVWLVLPLSGDPQRSVLGINNWLPCEDWYPPKLASIVWFGDDGVGNMLGWDPEQSRAILWNPEDGDEPWRTGSVEELWAFIVNGYAA